LDTGQKQMTPAELLHTDASRYATNRKEAYVKAMQNQEVILMTEIELNARWVAHYEGYREGYWVATGNSKFSTDPLKEKNSGSV
jgi:hypothetical protein